mgnify:CR=1 FL=1
MHVNTITVENINTKAVKAGKSQPKFSFERGIVLIIASRLPWGKTKLKKYFFLKIIFYPILIARVRVILFFIREQY